MKRYRIFNQNTGRMVADLTTLDPDSSQVLESWCAAKDLSLDAHSIVAVEVPTNSRGRCEA